MSNNLTTNASDDDYESVERIERFESLTPGNYWQARESVSSEDIQQGEVLLLLKVAVVDGAAHTITLQEHPSKQGRGEPGTMRFLLRDFMDKFEFCPDGEQIRAAEIRAITDSAQEAQNDLVSLQSNPQRLRAIVDDRVSKLRPKPSQGESHNNDNAPVASEKGGLPGAHLMDRGQLRTDVGFAIQKGLTQHDVDGMIAVAQLESDRATETAKVLSEYVGKISETMQKLSPFYAEKAAVAMARTSEIRQYAQEIMGGIASMDLYTGKGVEVNTICEGAQAPAGMPLALMQRKLFLEEELSVWLDVDESFDYTQISKVMETLAANPDFRDQMMPAERCVVSVATKRNDRYYENAYESMRKNKMNREVFLLVRNGENIHQVFSCQPSHEAAARLFPTSEENESLFRGADGTTITYNDIRFTDAREKSADLSLHYKRFLILLCGLDHRLKLMGDFYPPNESLSFISAGFQERNFQFANDDDRSHLLGEKLSAAKLMEQKNAVLQSGSRVVCFYQDLISTQSAPGAFSSSYVDGRYRQIAEVCDPEIFKIVTRRERDLVVDVQMRRTSYNEKTDGNTFNAKVVVASADTQWADNGVLCLDAVTPQELEKYVKNRDTRIHHTGYIRLLKRALVHLEKEDALARPTIDRLVEDVIEGGLTQDKDQAHEWVLEAITSWRAAKRGAPVPPADDHKALKAIQDQIYTQRAGHDSLMQGVETYIIENNLNPLSLVLTGSNQPVLYVQTPEDQRVEGIEWRWVTRIVLKTLKSKVSAVRSSLYWLQDKDRVDESELKSWPELASAKNESPPPCTGQQYLDAINLLSGVEAGVGQILGESGWNQDWFDEALAKFKAISMGGAKTTVTSVRLEIPVGMSYAKGRIKHLVISCKAESALYSFGNAAQKDEVIRSMSMYMSPEGRIRSLKSGELTLRLSALKRCPPEFVGIRESQADLSSSPRGMSEAERYQSGKTDGIFSEYTIRTAVERINHWKKNPWDGEQIFVPKQLLDDKGQVRLPSAITLALAKNEKPEFERVDTDPEP